YITKDGGFGRFESTDVADPGAFVALLEFVRQRISELADQMIDGLVEPRPYRIGRVTPCSHCEYRALCRFEPAINSYHTLSPMKRSEVLDRVIRKGGRDGG